MNLKQSYLTALGIDIWVPRKSQIPRLHLYAIGEYESRSAFLMTSIVDESEQALHEAILGVLPSVKLMETIDQTLFKDEMVLCLGSEAVSYLKQVKKESNVIALASLNEMLEKPLLKKGLWAKLQLIMNDCGSQGDGAFT